MTPEPHDSAADEEATEKVYPVMQAQSASRERASSFVAWLRERFFSRETADAFRTERLITLTRAIERFPGVAANYVVRGELFLELSKLRRAEDDFTTAYHLAEGQFANARWGVVAQALRDRALAGLEAARSARQLVGTDEDDTIPAALPDDRSAGFFVEDWQYDAENGQDHNRLQGL